MYPLLAEGKSVILNNRLVNKKNEDDKLISKIKHLRTKINFFKSKLVDVSNDSSKNEAYRSKLIDYDLRYDSLVRLLSHVDYTKKRSNSLIYASDSNAYTVEYFFSKNDVYYFLRQGKTLVDFNKISLSNHILSILNKRNPTLEELKFLSKVFYYPLKDYTETSFLKIIPDGPLWNLNFELLLTDDPKLYSKNKIPYLIKKYSISYAYSSYTLPDAAIGSEPNKKVLLAFSYGKSGSIYGKQLSLKTLRSSKDELPGSKAEVRSIANLIDGNYYYGDQASEKQFKDHASDYQILHLAVHGEANVLEPEKSKLYFYAEGDTIEDGKLHAFELYSMDIGADLAVLSACNTGSGEVAQGEGIISLGRAFSYAGVNSLLLTRWEVSDTYTPEIMEVFYREIKNGKRKSEALRTAKLEFLEKADNISSDTFYWSSFYILGDDSPIHLNESQLWKYFLVASILMAMAFIGYMAIRYKQSTLKVKISHG